MKRKLSLLIGIAAIDSPILKVLRLLRLDSVFETYNNTREARESFAESA